jgi:hypothetical protein
MKGCSNEDQTVLDGHQMDREDCNEKRREKRILYGAERRRVDEWRSARRFGFLGRENGRQKK